MEVGVLFKFKPLVLAVVQLLGGVSPGLARHRTTGWRCGLLEAAAAPLLGPGARAAVCGLLLRVLAAGVPWAKRVRFRVAWWDMAAGEASTESAPISLYGGQELAS